MDLLAVSMSTLAGKVTQMQEHTIELTVDKVNNSWAQRGEKCNNEGPEIVALPAVRPHTAPTWPEHTEAMIQTLRENAALMKQAADQQASLQARMDKDPSQGDFINFKSVKTGWDRIGGAEHRLKYVRWPQEAVFICP